MQVINTKHLKEVSLIKSFSNASIGFMGGSFNPAHLGHLHIANTAIKKLNLNVLFWVITPSNPLKKISYQETTLRQQQALKIVKSNPKIKILLIEEYLKNNYTYKTIEIIKKCLGNKSKLFWIMGEDNLNTFFRFKRWKDILQSVNILFIAREPNSYKSLMSKSAKLMKFNFVNLNNLLINKNNSWSFLLSPKINISSTLIRQSQQSKV